MNSAKHPATNRSKVLSIWTTKKWHGSFVEIHLFLDNLGHDVDGDGEDDGGVVLGGDTVQGLQVPELQQSVLYISVHCPVVL